MPAPRHVFVLVVVGGPERGHSWRLGPGCTRIGRSSENEIVLTDPKVSRLQLEVHLGEGGGRLAACSEKGTVVVDGRRVAEAPLAAGSVVELGDTRLLVEETVVDRGGGMPVRVEEQREARGDGYPGVGGRVDAGADRPARNREVLYQAALTLSRATAEEPLRAALVELARRGMGGGRAIPLSPARVG